MSPIRSAPATLSNKILNSRPAFLTFVVCINAAEPSNACTPPAEALAIAAEFVALSLFSTMFACCSYCNAFCLPSRLAISACKCICLALACPASIVPIAETTDAMIANSAILCSLMYRYFILHTQQRHLQRKILGYRNLCILRIT